MNCASCKFWDNSQSEYDIKSDWLCYKNTGIKEEELGYCNAEDPENMMVSVCGHEGMYGSIITRSTFSCALFKSLNSLSQKPETSKQ